MLSQVERGETSPTLQVAARIAAGLELRLSQLLRLDEDGAVTSCARASGARGPAGSAGHSYEILTPPLPGQRAELSRHTLAARRGHRRPRRPADARARQPRDRAGRVRHGRAASATAQRYELRAGDCVTFDADLPHHFENPGPRGGRAARGRQRRPAKELGQAMPKTLFDKIWDAHEVAPGLIYIDLHLVHEVTSPQAFDGLRLAGRKVRRPDRTLATADHNVPDRRDARRRADPRRALARAGRDARAQLRGVRRSRSTRSAPSTRGSCT